MKFKTSFKNLSVSEIDVQFVNGEYETTDKKKIEALKKFDFIQVVEEIKQSKLEV